jgi:ATP-dependent DNA helicase RecG
MPEKQDTEFKSVRKDEYLEWVCGFTNANGGRIFVGIDNEGKVIGVENYEDLMELIPVKTRYLMGVAVEVNLLQKEDKYYIEVNVPKYSVPISLRGRYYYRSGSVKQELKGTALNEFLPKRVGLTWDDRVGCDI